MSAKDITFKQVPRQKLAETVSQQLLEAVRDKEPGTQLPSERALVEQLGVGRSTVREALKGLAMIGVIEIRHGQGVFVASHQASVPGAMGFESVEAAKLVEARNIVEPELARLAAARRTAADVDALDEILTAHRKALDEGAPPLLEASRFHIHLADAAHNPVLSAVVQPFFRWRWRKGRSSTSSNRSTKSGSCSSTWGSSKPCATRTPPSPWSGPASTSARWASTTRPTSSGRQSEALHLVGLEAELDRFGAGEPYRHHAADRAQVRHQHAHLGLAPGHRRRPGGD